MARDHCRSRLPDRDRDGAGWQTLRPALRASSCRQSRPARRRRRDAPDGAPRRSRLSLLPNIRKCSAKPPRRRRYPLSLNYLGVRTVEDELELAEADMAGIGLAPRRSMAAED